MAYEKILTENSTSNSGMNSGCIIQSKRATASIAESSDIVLKEGELCFVYEGTKPYNVNIRMGDLAHRKTDLKLEEMEKRLSAIYSRAEKIGFTLDIASLSAPRYIKFCVKGDGANLTATLTQK